MTSRDATGMRCHEPAATSQIIIRAEERPESESPTSELTSSEFSESDSGIGSAEFRAAVQEDPFPLPGERFLHFQLVEEIGRGAFARVYVAKQDSLANRLVVLKIATLTSDEPQKLARLQHANIVPVYSVHALDKLEVICMPYLGRTTLHRVMAYMGSATGKRPANGRELLAEITHTPAIERGPLPENFATLGRMSLIETVLWLGAQLASGLAHAHRRGILHRDLKPANILITADAVPMLLDFNVSSESGRASSSDRIGGTFPYMAPEHLQAFDGAFTSVDERSDLYSLGVILYELLTGRLPHPVAPEMQSKDGNHAEMIAQRQTHPARPSLLNPAVPPSVDAIVVKLLEPAPARRYQRAEDLHADLTRQLANRPLRHASNGSLWERARKWRKRNPRLATGLAVASLALVLLILPAAAIAAQQARQTARAAQLQKAEAHNDFALAIGDLQTAAVLLGSRSDPAMREQGFTLGRTVLDRYQVADDAEWESRPGFALLDLPQRQELRSGFGELLILMTRYEMLKDPPAAASGLRWNQLARVMFAEGERPAVIARQGAELQGRDAAAAAPPVAASTNTIDLYFDGLDHATAGHARDALPYLTRFCGSKPNHFQAWFARGICHDALGQFADAAAAFAVCLSLRPDFPHAYLNRGLSGLKLRRYAEAEADFTRALELKPNWLPPLINRGIARDALHRPRESEADYTAALGDPACPTRVWFLRARARRTAGDPAGYAADRAQGFDREPTDALSYRTRATWWREAGEFNKSIADFDAALKLHPGDVDALLNKGIVLADYLHREADAIPVFDRLLELAPDHVDARCSRGTYHARLGHIAEARRDAERALKEDSSAYRQFQAAGLFAQLSKVDAKARQDAVRCLARALRSGFNEAKLLNGDHDLDPIRKEPAVVKLLAAVDLVELSGR
jgi:eukaryotic-like serine/threonine-protein kinase